MVKRHTIVLPGLPFVHLYKCLYLLRIAANSRYKKVKNTVQKYNGYNVHRQKGYIILQL